MTALIKGTSRLTVPQTNNILQHNIEYILEILLPGGELIGNEYTVLNPNRDDTRVGSFKINIKTGVWADFADESEKSKGGDLISLVQFLGYFSGKTPIQARRAAHGKCNALIKEHGLANGKSEPKTIKPKPKKEKPPTEVIAEEDLKVLPPDCDLNGNMVSNIWEYRTAEDEISFYVARFDLDDGSKETKPVRYSQEKWVWSYPEGKRPLLNCQYIKPGSRVIFSEGEKTCTHLMQFKEYVSVTSSGGSGRLFESDLEPLQKAAEVIIFSDADVPGNKYTSQIIGYCVANEIAVRILDVDFLGWKNGEDAADFPELTWSGYEPKE